MLVEVPSSAVVDHDAHFRPVDADGVSHRIVIGERVRIGVGAVIYGGVVLGDDVVVEDNCIVGKPETGYAVGMTRDGSLRLTVVGRESVMRAGSCIYSGVRLGEFVSVGHNTVVRSDTSIGDHSQLAHMVSVERACTLGQYVRCSPLTHITSSVVAEDRVFFGAGVCTINDKGMQWREPDGSQPDLLPPYFEFGCRIGTGSTVAAGVRVGREALVGSGSYVHRDVPAGTVVVGSPARVVRDR